MDDQQNGSVVNPDTDVPLAPGESPIPEGNVRLYHQTDASNIQGILKKGITFENARGIEGPKAIYADEKGFYGKPGQVPTIEFSIPKERWSHPPFVLGDVKPSEIVAAHLPWHETVRYLEEFPEQIKRTLQGEHDSLMDGSNSKEDKAVRYIKQKYKPHKADGGDVDGITAYHGSPHDFDEFDTSKIGTGEGAQSYGHGLYFAGHEPVAKEYRDRLAKEETSSGETIADQHVIAPHFYKDMSDQEIAEHMDEAASWADKKIFDQGKMKYLYDDGSMLIHDEDRVRAVQKQPGHMYEVHINAHLHHMLDWDKPLSEQSDHVQKALDSIQDHPDWTNGFKNELKRARGTNYFDGNDLYRELIKAKSAPEIAQMLHGAGIKGIKYLDAGSRSDESKQTHNYVVFDHSDVHVKRKYEQGGAVNGYEDGGEVGNHPEVPDVVYHGTNKDISDGFNIPAFFAGNPQHADYYANWRGEEGARVYPAKLSMKNPLDVRGREGAMKFIDVARRAGAKVDVQHFPNGSWDFDTDEISKHSDYDGTNLNDLVYSPRVRKQMQKEGYDGLMAHDQLGNEEIPIFVALHPHQIKSSFAKKRGGPIATSGPIVKRALELLSKDRTGR